MLVDENGNFLSIGFAIAFGLAALFTAVAATVLAKLEINQEVVSILDDGLKFIEDTIKFNITMRITPLMLAYSALDNVMMSKRKGNLKDTGLPSDIPSEEKLREDYHNARKRGDQQEAKRIQLLQKILGYRNKQKRNSKKPKGTKGRNFIFALLIHETIRRF